MTKKDVWRRLGIAATADTKKIRSAYAARLKALDVDAERDAFALLRTARDQALAWAAEAPQKPEPPAATREPVDTPAPSIGLTDLRAPIIAAAGDIRIAAPPLPDFMGPATAPDCRTPPGTAPASIVRLPGWAVPLVHPLPPAAGRITIGGSPPRHDQALHALLYTADNELPDAPLTNAEIVQARVLIEALFTQAKSDTIDFDAQLQNWLSQTLAQAWPRSQPILDHAATRFGWDTREGQIDVPPPIAYINNRIAAERFLAAVQAPGHDLNTAWRQLTRPARDNQSRAFWRHPKKVAELLNAVRRHYPEMESHFDPRRVAMWGERKQGRRRIPWRLAIFGIIVLIQIISAVARYNNGNSNAPAVQLPPRLVEGPITIDRNPNPRPGGLTRRDADMTTAIHATLGPDVTADQLRDTVPSMEILYRVNWGAALDQGESLDNYIAGMAHIVRGRYALLARQAGGDTFVEYQKLRLAEARALKTHNWGGCAQMMRKGALADPDMLPASLVASERKPIGKLILAMPGNPVPPPAGGETFSIPGPIVGRTVATAGLPLDQVQAAFKGKGDDRTICRTTIALMQAVLTSDKATRDDLLPKI